MESHTGNASPGESLLLPLGGVLRSAIFVFCGVLVILTNGCSLGIVRRQKDVFGEISRLIYKRIAIIDLIGGLSGCVFYAIFMVHNTWPFKQWSCRALITILYGAALQSMACLTCVNVDRYIAVSRPLRYHSIVTIRFAKMALGLTFIPVLAFITISLVPQTPCNKLLRVYCTSRNETLDMDKTERVFLASSYVLLMTPIFVGMTLNFVSMIISVQHARALVAAPAMEAPASLGHERNRPNILACKGVKTILLISAVNLLALAPNNVRLNFTLRGSDLPAWLDVILAILTLVNFWSNAPIFALTNAAYRNQGKALIKSLHCKDARAILRTSSNRESTAVSSC